MTCSTQKVISKIKWNTLYFPLVFKSNWLPVNLTGSEIKFSVKKNTADITHVLQEILTITDAVNGKAELSVDLTMDADTYVYEFLWTKSDGKKQTLELGKLTITNWAT